jgi:phosphoglycolate phosphatase-like HAD superfamily hydrolase
VALHTLETCGLAHHFHPDHVLGRECADPKPSPEGIARLLAAWAADPEDAVMVGDYRDDAETGRAAGVATVLVRRRHHHADHEADYVVDRLDTLIEALDPPTSPPWADG